MEGNKLIDGPIPGQSLTRSVGSRPYEQPPKYVDEDAAMYAILNGLTDKQSAPALIGMLKKGAYASDIANTILVGGVAEGKWTPDLAALIAKRTLGAVVAVGASQGVENIRFKRAKADDTMDKIMKLPDTGNRSFQRPKPQAPVKEPAVQIKGVMSDG